MEYSFEIPQNQELIEKAKRVLLERIADNEEDREKQYEELESMLKALLEFKGLACKPFEEYVQKIQVVPREGIIAYYKQDKEMEDTIHKIFSKQLEIVKTK